MAEDLQLQASKKRKMYAELENEELQVNCLSPVTSDCENELSVGGNSGGSPDLEVNFGIVRVRTFFFLFFFHFFFVKLIVRCDDK